MENHTVRFISTGSEEIDDKMGGGIPVGSLVLIEGSSHSGKSVLAQQMMWGSLYDGFRLAYFTTENTVASLVRQMQSLNIDIVDFLLLRRLMVFPMQVARLQGRAVKMLLKAVSDQATQGFDMIFVDALTPCIGSSPPEESLSYFESCKRLCADGATFVTVLHSHAVSQDLLIRITSLCDAHLRLRTDAVGDKLVKTMEVAKVRGARKNTGKIVSFEVEPGLGMRVVPISKAQG